MGPLVPDSFLYLVTLCNCIESFDPLLCKPLCSFYNLFIPFFKSCSFRHYVDTLQQGQAFGDHVGHVNKEGSIHWISTEKKNLFKKMIYRNHRNWIKVYKDSYRAVYCISLSFIGSQMNCDSVTKFSVYFQDRSNCHITLLYKFLKDV